MKDAGEYIGLVIGIGVVFLLLVAIGKAYNG